MFQTMYVTNTDNTHSKQTDWTFKRSDFQQLGDLTTKHDSIM